MAGPLRADRDPRSRGLRHGVQGPRSAARSRGGDQGPRAGNLATEDDRNRFLREARSVAQLRHEAIVPVHEVGEHEEVPYLVSDFVEGVTLADWLTAHRLPFPEIAQFVAEVADALQYAHDQGVIHRDVKPSNIMLDNKGKKPHLMDFGLAKRDVGEITMTRDGEVLGTPAYMSPEQARGEGHRVDGRSDGYSLGVILYELITGELPFRGNQRMLLNQVLHDEPKAPRKLNDCIPRDLETICLKAMAKEPAGRYATASELAADLKRWLRGEPILARPASRWERGWRWCRRNPWVATSVALLAASMLASMVGVILIGRAFQQRDIEAERFKKGRGILLEYAFQSRLDIRWLLKKGKAEEAVRDLEDLLANLVMLPRFRSCGR